MNGGRHRQQRGRKQPHGIEQPALEAGAHGAKESADVSAGDADRERLECQCPTDKHREEQEKNPGQLAFQVVAHALSFSLGSETGDLSFGVHGDDGIRVELSANLEIAVEAGVGECPPMLRLK